jgi:hypothetical protein
VKPENKLKLEAVKARQDAAKAEWGALDKGASTTASIKKRVEAIEKLLGLSSGVD